MSNKAATADEATGDNEPSRRPWWKKKRYVVPLTPVALFVLLLFAAAFSDSDEAARERAEELEAELATAQERAANAEEAEDRASRLEEQVEDAETRAEEAEETAREELEEELANRKAELEQQADEAAAEREDGLDQRSEELDERAAQLDDRESRIASREADLERTLQQQFGDGTWEVGVDIEPGRYRIEPGSGCYWARLRDRGAGVDSVIQNANPRGQQEVVDIAASDGYFESGRCGTWTPID